MVEAIVGVAVGAREVGSTVAAGGATVIWGITPLVVVILVVGEAAGSGAVVETMARLERATVAVTSASEVTDRAADVAAESVLMLVLGTETVE